MRKGKYYRYSLKILEYFFEKEPNEIFDLNHKCASVARKLMIPKTSFFDVLRDLENLEYISIQRKEEHHDYFGTIIRYFHKIHVTPKGARFYILQSERWL